jgi:ATP-dependent protease ClpP protease subunit
MTESEARAILAKPPIRLIGHVDEAMYKVFRDQLNAAPDEGPLAVSITTLGGDPEIARAMADDIRVLRENDDRVVLFLGKVAVYSAGATLMAGFPVECRYLTRATRLMIHERIIDKTIRLNGPLRNCVDSLKAALHEVEHSIEIEEEGFRAIVEGSQVDFATMRRRAPENWYIRCEEALELGLIAGII